MNEPNFEKPVEAPPFAIIAPLPFRQPKPGLRWVAVLLAAAGWIVSAVLFNVSVSGRVANPLLEAVCGGRTADNPDDCTSVLTSPQAYVQFGDQPGATRIPISAFGMAYFAFIAVWYLFIGPPAHAGRGWHVLLVAVLVLGGLQSYESIRVMAIELQRWCAGCLVVHTINGGLLLLTLGAWSWRAPTQPTARHPTARLALATATIGALLLPIHVAYAYLGQAGHILQARGREFAAVLEDPDYVVWDHARQPVVSIPLREDEVFAGTADAPNTVVVFGDFQCPACRSLHETLVAVAARHIGEVRVAFRYCPQDSACNPNPRYRSGGHASACRAAQAAEAALLVGGPQAFMQMRKRIWDGQNELPKRTLAHQSEAERKLLEDWAAGLGLDRSTFRAAMESPAVLERIQSDLELVRRLGLEAMPVVYLNNQRVRGWSKPEIWDALLGAKTQASGGASTAGRPI